jgi:hypothetical protein
MTLTADVTEVRRDRWGRPLILQPDGSTEPYTRPSTLAKTLSDSSALTQWAQRRTAWGVATRADLVALAATADGPDDRGRLTEVVGAAMEAAASGAGARMGTAIHSATEAFDTGGITLADLPDVVRAQVEVYAALTARLDTLDVELFVVNDTVKVAGTTDRLFRLPDGRVVVGDLKTSSASAPKYAALEWAIQLACYAGGARYDTVTGERTLLHADLDPTVGLVVHVPAGDVDQAAIYTVNLTWGAEAARLAARVRRARKAPFLAPWELETGRK